MAGANHIIKARKYSLKSLPAKAVLTVLLADIPTLAPSKTIDPLLPSGIPRFDTLNKTLRGVVGGLIKVKPEEPSLFFSYPDRKIVDAVIAFF